jgi:hypothetical protein
MCAAHVVSAGQRPLRLPPAIHSRGEDAMTVERALRMIAGAFVVVSVGLGMYVHPGFYWFTAFVGLNLFQSAFTKWCPMMSILRLAGLKG